MLYQAEYLPLVVILQTPPGAVLTALIGTCLVLSALVIAEEAFARYLDRHPQAEAFCRRVFFV